MKETIILALKDKNGNYYACDSFIDRNKSGIMEKLYQEHAVEVPVVEIFPYSTFSSFSTYDTNLYEFVYLRALVELSESEFANFSRGNVRTYKFYKRKVQALEETKKPFLEVKRIFEHHLKEKEYIKASNIRYGALTWMPKFGFCDDAEFEVFVELFKYEDFDYDFSKDCSFSPTDYNRKYLESVLLKTDMKIEISHRHNGSFLSTDIDELVKLVDTFLDDAFIDFHEKTNLNHIKAANQNRINRRFFEEVSRRSRSDLSEYIPDMPKQVINEFGADYLLEQAFEKMDYMLIENEYEPDSFYEYDDYYDGHSPRLYTYDGRDAEVEMIDNILPYVTEKSLPFLKKLVFEKIKDMIPEHLKVKL